MVCRASTARRIEAARPMFNNPFRERALAASANRRQQLDHLLRVTAPHERIVLGAIAMLLASLGLWALLGSIERDVVIEGMVVAPGTRHELVAAEPGHLIELLVAAGDRVEAGTPIARQSVPELAREEAALRERVALLSAEAGQTGGGATASLLAAAQAALLQIEAQRATRELIVSQVAGEVMALRAAPGAFLPAGAAVAQLREADAGPLQARLQVAARVAQHLRPGMPASVTVQLGDGSQAELDGTVGAVGAGPAPERFAALGPAGGQAPRRVDIDLQPASGMTLPDGTPCRVRIVLGRQTPVSFIGLGRS